jgi:hypothetical protein
MQAHSLSSLDNDVISIVKPHCCTTILMFPSTSNASICWLRQIQKSKIIQIWIFNIFFDIYNGNIQAYSLCSLENDVFSSQNALLLHNLDVLGQRQLHRFVILCKFKISSNSNVDYLHVAQNISWKYI